MKAAVSTRVEAGKKKKLQPFGSCSELQVFLEPGGHFHHQAPPVLEGRL
jgi:hypothetical protein